MTREQETQRQSEEYSKGDPCRSDAALYVAVEHSTHNALPDQEPASIVIGR